MHNRWFTKWNRCQTRPAGIVKNESNDRVKLMTELDCFNDLNKVMSKFISGQQNAILTYGTQHRGNNNRLYNNTPSPRTNGGNFNGPHFRPNDGRPKNSYKDFRNNTILMELDKD